MDKISNRILSLILCACTVFTGVGGYIPTLALDLVEEDTNPPSVEITLDGEATSEIAIGKFEKRTAHAELANATADAMQWQILVSEADDLWVDIFDKTTADCEISTALVEGMLDTSGAAYLRCRATAGGTGYYSDPLKVQILDSAPTEQEIPHTPKLRKLTVGTQTLSDNDETEKYVTVTINYLRIENGTQVEVYKPYVANVLAGSSFAQTVISPTLLGYAPYYDSDGDGTLESADSITFNIDKIDESIVINVFYEPIEVNYSVRYFFQNIGDDLYTENAGLFSAKSALTGTVVTEEMLKLSDANSSYTVGFTKMYHIPDAVAADGSTVFECYYDRLYYLLIFDNNGGYGTDPIYARYGTSFVVNDPIRYGYVFLGWDVDGNGIIDTNDTLPTSIQANNDADGNPIPVTYTAIWERVDTKYTIAYWAKDSSNKQYFLGSSVVSAKSGDTVSGGDTLLSSTSYICGKEGHTHTSDCCAYLHTHTADCLGTVSAGNTPSEADQQVMRGASGGDSIKSGFLYTITVASNATGIWYYLYIDGTWYSGSGSMITADPIGEYTEYVSGYKDTYTAKMYYPRLSCGYEHSNGTTISCGKDVHTHSNDCVFSSHYLEFVSADQNVEVAGDGSTVVNVYYKHKDYTLRFYYARSSVDTSGTVYEVVGGSTYAFGANGSDTTVANLLKNPSDWGKVKSLPQINTDYIRDEDLISKYKLTSGSIDSDFDSTYTYYYLEFTAAFGSDISTVWPVDIFEPVEVNEKHSEHSGTDDNFCQYTYAYFSAWNGQYGVKYSHGNTNQTIKGMYQYLDENLIFDTTKFPSYADRTEISYLCFWENGADVDWSIPKIFEYNIYIEGADGNYTLLRKFNVYDDSTVDQQTKATLDGYSFVNKDMSDMVKDETTGLDKYVISYYYKLETKNHLYFYNYNEIEKNISGIPFGTGLSEWLDTNGYGDYIDLPPYPEELETNAYSFGGWYTTSDCYTGTEFDLDSETMPSNDLTLYAKWTPVSHEVNFFTTLDELREYESDDSVSPYYYRKIVHGNVVGSVSEPENGELIFKGWFYIDETEGGKRAFVPTAMPINKDLNIYAEWDSHTAVPFRIRYVLADDPSIQVADDTTGYAYASTTRTFGAKAGEPLNQLYDAYREGYYPTVSSHSITMQLDEEQNVYTFYYSHEDKVSYTVNYFNRETGVLMDTETHDTDRSVVTVSYKHYENMIPDAFYKQLVLSANESENVVNFYYTPNSVKVYYAVHYMLEKLDAEETDLSNYAPDGTGGYEDSGTYLTGIADKGSTVSVSSESFTGFGVTTTAILVSGDTQTIVATSDGGATFSFDNLRDGDELYIFYTRNSYDYEIHYYQYNTTVEVKPSTSGNEKWGKKISLAAPAIDGYKCVNLESDGMRHLTVKEGGNILIFYYAPVQRVIEYVAVVDGSVLDGAGRLSGSREIVAGSETIVGSIARSDAFYRFEGWFADEECTIPLVNGTHGTLTDENADGVSEKFVPYGTTLSETDTNTFYAKFTPITGDITVKLDGSTVGQVSVIEIKNMLTGETIRATVNGNGTVVVKNVHLNNYTVSVSRDWSWRYDDCTVTCTHSNASGTTVQLTLQRSSEQWLSGGSEVLQNTHSGVNTDE